MGRPKVYKDKKRKVIELEGDLLRLINKMAKMQGKNTNEYIVENILLEIQGHVIFCPKCQEPVLDERTILVSGNLILHCSSCGHDWEYKDDEI